MTLRNEVTEMNTKEIVNASEGAVQESSPSSSGKTLLRVELDDKNKPIIVDGSDFDFDFFVKTARNAIKDAAFNDDKEKNEFLMKLCKAFKLSTEDLTREVTSDGEILDGAKVLNKLDEVSKKFKQNHLFIEQRQNNAKDSVRKNLPVHELELPPSEDSDADW